MDVTPPEFTLLVSVMQQSFTQGNEIRMPEGHECQDAVASLRDRKA
jgi:hypothetical protein